MPSAVLSFANAYNPGSDLWVLPELSRSLWTQKIDWYLNFQINRNLTHASLQLPSEVQSIIEDTELQITSVVADPALSPLMIGSQDKLPNRWVTIVPGSEKFLDWVKLCNKLWSNLNKPSLRVFLPPGQNASSFLESWRKLSSMEDITIVLDSEYKIGSNDA